ncbi:hypothetical protein [Glutamicibacter nicotianae]|uniref:hypothetical protein n=1 Tax=Glutamicibacter nicotianae TaxID=37929 RepID=UPI0025553DCB|nr:hypothetical protein [Glutamicibacter nicotianae]WIV45418.1 hypothetical protein QQS42_07500 [Glutamicibacter nicotianae]
MFPNARCFVSAVYQVLAGGNGCFSAMFRRRFEQFTLLLAAGQNGQPGIGRKYFLPMPG